MKITYIITALLLTVLLLCACGSQDKKQTPIAPETLESTAVPTKPVESQPNETKPVETPDDPVDPVDPNFPTFEVGYYAGKDFILIKNTEELKNCLSMMQTLCGEGKPFQGIGVRLHGFEVQKSDVNGLPYCHVSYGTKENLLTVFGFEYDVLGELDATLVSELLRMCPYFTKAEFYPVADATHPDLVL